MPLPKPENRQRRWAPKVRSGCLTCKRRKKRCDEEKPICRMCRNGKYICDGYEALIPLSHSTPAEIAIKAQGKTDSLLTSLASHTPLNAWKFRRNLRTDSTSLSSECSVMLANRHLNHALSVSDQKYAQFFVVRVAPVLATTIEWSSFWESTVPKVSLGDCSVYQAMIALSATYESKASGVDRSTKTLQQINRAVRAALSEPSCTTNTLILCRLLASIAQAMGDWKMAMIHLQHGWKILSEAAQGFKIDSTVARLLAPTFLCASTDPIPLRYCFGGADSAVARSFACLEDIRSHFLAKLLPMDLRNVEGHQKSFILTCWSIMTQTSCSLVYSDALTYPADHSTVSIHDVRTNLECSQMLLSLSELQEKSVSVFNDMEAYLQTPSNQIIPWSYVRHGLQVVVENFLVQATAIEPRVNVGMFWFDEKVTCDIDDYVRCQESILTADLKSSEHSLLSSPGRIDQESINYDLRQQKRAYYVEFVCPYRSGLMPAFINNS